MKHQILHQIFNLINNSYHLIIYLIYLQHILVFVYLLNDLQLYQMIFILIINQFKYNQMFNLIYLILHLTQLISYIQMYIIILVLLMLIHLSIFIFQFNLFQNPPNKLNYNIFIIL